MGAAFWDLQAGKGQDLFPEAPSAGVKRMAWGLEREQPQGDCLEPVLQEPGFDTLGGRQEKRPREDTKGAPQVIPRTNGPSSTH